MVKIITYFDVNKRCVKRSFSGNPIKFFMVLNSVHLHVLSTLQSQLNMLQSLDQTSFI